VATVFFSLASKLVGTVFFSLASKLVGTVYPGLASKLVVGFLVEPQNQGGGGFSGLGLKTDRFSLVIWVSKLLRQFLVWFSKSSVLQFVSCVIKPME
jgi:hypothetical protein